MNSFLFLTIVIAVYSYIQAILGRDDVDDDKICELLHEVEECTEVKQFSII